ncbi:MAG: TetR family transcriptional regulator [Flaviflexus sp.]|uniref:TetR/AcrR family transcriptional regulator n=1 Tax=Flaviflexus sp. TaxID=1969482 RepID=UPI00352E04CC
MERVKHARDPHRKERIIDACLTSIVSHGVAGTSHRKIAALADVPLGSMTYYFDGFEDLLGEAFSKFAKERIDEFEDVMSKVTTMAEFRANYIAYVSEVLLEPDRNLILTLELYTIAARDAAFRTITWEWMSATRSVLSRFVDTETATLLDGIIEGLSLHRALGLDPGDPSLVARAFDQIVGEH